MDNQDQELQDSGFWSTDVDRRHLDLVASSSRVVASDAYRALQSAGAVRFPWVLGEKPGDWTCTVRQHGAELVLRVALADHYIEQSDDITTGYVAIFGAGSVGATGYDLGCDDLEHALPRAEILSDILGFTPGN